MDIRVQVVKYLKRKTTIVSIVVSAVALIIMAYSYYTDLKYKYILKNTLSVIITVTGVLIGTVIVYIMSKQSQIIEHTKCKIPKIKELTNKIDCFVKIANYMLNSNLLSDEAKKLIDNEYEGLNYFDYRKNTYVNANTTEQSIRYCEDERNNGISNLYLELRTFCPRESDFNDDKYKKKEHGVYNIDLIEEWVKYDCGNGLWYYFENEYSNYKNNGLNINGNIQRFEKEIFENYLKINDSPDNSSVLDENLFAKLGTKIYNIIRELYEIQYVADKGLEQKNRDINIMFSLSIIFGIILPIFDLIFDSLFPFLSIISISVMIGIYSVLALTFIDTICRESKLSSIIE